MLKKTKTKKQSADSVSMMYIIISIARHWQILGEGKSGYGVSNICTSETCLIFFFLSKAEKKNKNVSPSSLSRFNSDAQDT